MITTLRDIHQQVLDRMALALSEQTFRAAMIGAPQGMAVVGLHGSFLQTNQMLADLLGYDDAWLTSHKESDLVHPDDLESDLMARDRLLSRDVGLRHPRGTSGCGIRAYFMGAALRRPGARSECRCSTCPTTRTSPTRSRTRRV